MSGTFFSKSLQTQALQMAQGRSSDFHHEWVLRILQSEGLPLEASVLDFGAGQGFLIRALKNHGLMSLMGADLLPAPAEINTLWKQADLNSFPSQEFSQKFDWVIGVEVIEHLENPRNTLRQMAQMIKPGGKILLTTPNVESWRSFLSFMLRGHFVDFLDSSYPAHITPIIRMDLERIIKECGLEIRSVQYSDKGVLPFFTKWTWQKISARILKGKRFSDHILLVARKVK